MSDTPRTDAAEIAHNFAWSKPLANYARELEREVAELRGLLLELRSGSGFAACSTLVARIDAALAGSEGPSDVTASGYRLVKDDEAAGVWEAKFYALQAEMHSELVELRALVGDVKTALALAEDGYERDMATIDLIEEVQALRRGVGVSRPAGVDPIARLNMPTREQCEATIAAARRYSARTETPARGGGYEALRMTNSEGHKPDCDFLNPIWGATACNCGVRAEGITPDESHLNPKKERT